MLRDKTVAAVVPAFNEETQISRVVETMPDFVDWIVVIDDASSDGTWKILESLARTHERLVPIRHAENQGVGGAIASGYKWCGEKDIDCAVVLAGDGQMQPDKVEDICLPVVLGKADYSKANRLISESAYRKIPITRFVGNSGLSFLTKIASGYWHIADSQSGFAAIGKLPLKLIDWDRMYKRYGQPNDILVKLNVYNFRVQDVAMEPVYGVGEQSKMKKRKVLFTISWLLLKSFFWRMKEKYIYREFHPLVLFYCLSLLLLLTSVGFGIRLILKWSEDGLVPEITLVGLLFSITVGLMCAFFAMFFDMERSRP
ncbi:MAG: ribonuclease BN [Planctomycetaceae bacterium]|nr:ribonuclease BN [Planctomycetaceae bacterium]